MSGAQPIQRRLRVDTSDRGHVDRVRDHLRELAGATAGVELDEHGQVALHDLRADPEAEMTAGHRLLHSLVNHRHTTTIAPARGADALSSEPVLPDNSTPGKLLDWFKGFQFMRQRGYLTHQARAFVHGATPGTGVGTVVHYDSNLPATAREGWVRTDSGDVERHAAPQSLSLGHELIHSEHFHRGVAAYDPRGLPIVGGRQHTFSKFSRGEATNMEEINAVGLDLLPPEHGFHDHMINLDLSRPNPYQRALSDRDRRARLVTEQELRRQFGLRPRAGYER